MLVNVGEEGVFLEVFGNFYMIHPIDSRVSAQRYAVGESVPIAPDRCRYNDCQEEKWQVEAGVFHGPDEEAFKFLAKHSLPSQRKWTIPSRCSVCPGFFLKVIAW